jgi:hypothetical protein
VIPSINVFSLFLIVQLWNLSKEVQYLQQLQNLRKWCRTWILI